MQAVRLVQRFAQVGERAAKGSAPLFGFA
jgi:hypothetical protein